MKEYISIIAFLLFITPFCYGQSNSQIKTVFIKFQEGYAKRDTSQAGKFTDDLCSKDIELIGTGDEEWFQGIAAAKNLFKNDWMYWFNLTIDTSSINLTGDDSYKFFYASRNRINGIS